MSVTTFLVIWLICVIVFWRAVRSAVAGPNKKLPGSLPKAAVFPRAISEHECSLVRPLPSAIREAPQQNGILAG